MLSWWLTGKVSSCDAGEAGLNPGPGRFPWRGKWQPTLVFLPGNPMNRGDWWAQSMEVIKSRGHNWVTKQLQQRKPMPLSALTCFRIFIILSIELLPFKFHLWLYLCFLLINQVSLLWGSSSSAYIMYPLCLLYYRYNSYNYGDYK